jgi:hypothetical protein
LSTLPLAQIWIVVQTGASGVIEASDAVHWPTRPRFGVG